MEVKIQTAVAYKKTCCAGKNGCCCATYIMVCAGKKRKLSMERETSGFDFVIRPLCCVCSALLSPHRDDLLQRETLIVLSSKLVIDQVSCLDRLNVIAGYVYL